MLVNYCFVISALPALLLLFNSTPKKHLENSRANSFLYCLKNYMSGIYDLIASKLKHLYINSLSAIVIKYSDKITIISSLLGIFGIYVIFVDPKIRIADRNLFQVNIYIRERYWSYNKLIVCKPNSWCLCNKK